MNLRTPVLTSLALSLVALSVSAAETRPLRLTEIIVDCNARTLPSQSDVSNLLGIDNFSEAYAARTRLMAEVGRACKKAGSQQVRVALDSSKVTAGRRDLARVDGAGRR